VIFLDGRGELPMIEVSTAWSTAEILFAGRPRDALQEKE